MLTNTIFLFPRYRSHCSMLGHLCDSQALNIQLSKQSNIATNYCFDKVCQNTFSTTINYNPPDLENIPIFFGKCKMCENKCQGKNKTPYIETNHEKRGHLLFFNFLNFFVVEETKQKTNKNCYDNYIWFCCNFQSIGPLGPCFL